MGAGKKMSVKVTYLTSKILSSKNGSIGVIF